MSLQFYQGLIDDGDVIFNDYNSIISNLSLLVDEMNEYSINNGLDTKTRYMNDFNTKISNNITYLNSFDNQVENVKDNYSYKVRELTNFIGTSEVINTRLNSYIKDKCTVINNQISLPGNISSNILTDKIVSSNSLLFIIGLCLS